MKTSRIMSVTLLFASLVPLSACASAPAEGLSATRPEPSSTEPVVVTLAVGGVT